MASQKHHSSSDVAGARVMAENLIADADGVQIVGDYVEAAKEAQREDPESVFDVGAFDKEKAKKAIIEALKKTKIDVRTLARDDATNRKRRWPCFCCNQQRHYSFLEQE